MPKKIKNRVSEFVLAIENERKQGICFGEFSKEDFKEIATFIEKKLSAYIKMKKYYLMPHETKLSCPIQYDPISKKVFIHLGTNKGMLPIGQGGQKLVTMTIEYAKNPNF